MDSTVLSVNALPELLIKRFNIDKVRVQEENGIITLTPIDKSNQLKAIDRLMGMFAGKLSSEDYVAQKQIDKELER